MACCRIPGIRNQNYHMKNSQGVIFHNAITRAASCLRAEFAVRRRSNQAEENVARRVMKTRSTETLRINI